MSKVCIAFGVYDIDRYTFIEPDWYTSSPPVSITSSFFGPLSQREYFLDYI